ncbi:MAG: hypothetical protein U5R48_16895 [Gammaproteobacteria bacterium]|nr:hypothetical protein [Gammaproteobacteria bacterium]
MRGCALLLALLLVSPLTALPAAAYREETLQDLTFLAAKRFNRCVERTSVPRLSALQVRNLVRGNLREADTNFLRRATRWNFYDRSRQDPRRLLWSIDTRFHDRFDDVADRVLAEETRDTDRYENLGTVVHYLQTVTIPADVVPIFHPRPWRWPAGDRFTLYELDPDERAAALGNLCPELLSTPEDETFGTLLDRTAAATMAAIRSPIADMDATWNVFWEEDEPGRFGSYGPAGNSFGREARFPCGEERCVLLAGDPIYREFALTQHRLAVLSTMRAVLVLQRRRAQREKAPVRQGDAAAGPRRDADAG